VVPLVAVLTVDYLLNVALSNYLKPRANDGISQNGWNNDSKFLSAFAYCHVSKAVGAQTAAIIF